MEKKGVIFGLANGIMISLVSDILSDINPLAILIMPAVLLIAEFILLRKKKSQNPVFYATSILVAVVILYWLMTMSFQY